MTAVVESCRVPPPPSAAAELSVPLSFMDIVWVHFHLIQSLNFYTHPCSKPEFLDSIVPKLKQSLSLTLKHYLPVAGNLLYPLNTDTNRPLIRYVSGDSVTLTIAVSSRDFDDLTGNHARECDQFYEFMPEMPPASRDDGVEYTLVPLVALQASLFPGKGISIGLSCHHSLGDVNSTSAFMSAWGSIHKYGGDEEFLSRNGDCLPLLDRSVLGDCGRSNITVVWNRVRKIPFKPPSSFPLPTNRVRASFTLRRSDITELKNRVWVPVSSFVAAMAYVWSCLTKSGAAVGEEVGVAETNEMFLFLANARGRPNAMVDPPVPLNYFGNCLGTVSVEIERERLAADDGFLVAAEAIADRIENEVNNKEEFLKSAHISKVKGSRRFGVAGSPKTDLLDADFGWGSATKLEVLSLDESEYSVSLCKSDGGRGLEIGVSLPKVRMEAFAAIFGHGLGKSHVLNQPSRL